MVVQTMKKRGVLEVSVVVVVQTKSVLVLIWVSNTDYERDETVARCQVNIHQSKILPQRVRQRPRILIRTAYLQCSTVGIFITLHLPASIGSVPLMFGRWIGCYWNKDCFIGFRNLVCAVNECIKLPFFRHSTMLSSNGRSILYFAPILRNM